MSDLHSRGDDWTVGAVVGWPFGLLTGLAPACIATWVSDAAASEWGAAALSLPCLATATLPFGMMAGWGAIRFRDARVASWPPIPTAGAGAYFAGTALGAVGVVAGLLT
ncbi:MAG: hypothetical protein AAF907_09440 [Planctomycetota bacterium]